MNRSKHYAIVTGVMIVLLGLLFMFTNPEQLPSAVLFLVFIGVYVALASGVIVLGSIVFRRDRQLFEPKTRRTIWVFAAVPVFFLLLQSIGQLTVRDVLLAFALVVLALAYMKRMSQAPTE